MKKFITLMLLLSVNVVAMGPYMSYYGDTSSSSTCSENNQSVTESQKMQQSIHQIINNQHGPKSGLSNDLTKGCSANYPAVMEYITLQKEGSLDDLMRIKEELLSACNKFWFLPMRKERALIETLDEIMSKPLTRSLAACKDGTYEQVSLALQQLVEEDRMSGGNLKDALSQASKLASHNKNFDPNTCTFILSSPRQDYQRYGYLVSKAQEKAQSLDISTMSIDEYMNALQDIARCHDTTLTERQKTALVVDLLVTGLERGYTNLKGSPLIGIIKTGADMMFGHIYLSEKEQIAYMDQLSELVTKYSHAYQNDDRETMRKGICFAVDMATTLVKNKNVGTLKKAGNISKALQDLSK